MLRGARVGWALLLTTVVCPSLIGAQETRSALRVLSFNIRYGTAADGPDSWVHRRDLVLDIVARGEWDFVGLQEALLFQVEEILAAAPELAAVVRSREVDPGRGETCALLYRRSRWSAEETGTFWLSTTPAEPGSRSWDAALPRIATWGLFAERDGGRRLHVVNTHFDHRGAEARERSAGVLRGHLVARDDGRPVVVLGDLNSGEGTPPILAMTSTGLGGPTLVDSWRVLHPDSAEPGTFNGWTGESTGPKIDFVLVTEDLEVLAAEIDRRDFGGRYPSDHYPVSATLR